MKCYIKKGYVSSFDAARYRERPWRLVICHEAEALIFEYRHYYEARAGLKDLRCWKLSNFQDAIADQYYNPHRARVLKDSINFVHEDKVR